MKNLNWLQFRDGILFILGVGTFIYVIISGDTRAPVLYSALALMGVGAALKGFTVVRKNGEAS